METATRNLDIVTRFKGGEQVKAGFDAEKISAKDLQERIGDLDKRMKMLTDTYGKHAYASKAGVIVQRERKLALEQLLILEEKEALATGKSTRGFGSLASAAMAASGSISGLGTGISVLTNSLMSGAGLTAGLAAAVAGFSILMEYLRGTNAEFETLKSQVSGLLKVEMPEGSFNIAPEKIPALLEKIRSSYRGLAHSEKYLYNLLPEGGGNFEKKSQQTVNNFQALIESLETTYNKYLNLKNIIKEFGDVGLGFTEDQTKAMKDREDAVKSLTTAYLKLAKIIQDSELEGEDMILGDYWKPQASDRSLGMRSGRYNLRGIDAEIEGQERLFKEKQKLYEDLFQDAANVFRSEFGSAWEDVFGEANSMFEKLIASWAQTLFEKLSGKALGGLLSLIPGGSVIGDLLGFSKAVSTANNYNSKLRID